MTMETPMYQCQEMTRTSPDPTMPTVHSDTANVLCPRKNFSGPLYRRGEALKSASGSVRSSELDGALLKSAALTPSL